MIRALAVEQVHQQRQRLLLNVPPRVEVDAEAVELVLAVARTKAKRETAIAENIDEGGVFRDAQRIGERQRHHRGADLDALRQRREIGGIDEHVRHDAVFVAEMMFGDPGVVVAELVGAQDLPGYPRVHIAVRIGLGVGVGMRSEKNAEFHAPSWMIRVSVGAATLAMPLKHCEEGNAFRSASTLGRRRPVRRCARWSGSSPESSPAREF